MSRAGSLAVLAWVGFGGLVIPAAAQPTPRIRGTVETLDGAVHTGYLRWDGEAAAWADLLRGTRTVPREQMRIWREATGRDTTPPIRVVEVMGYRISWNEEDPEFASSAAAGIRFAHLRELRPVEPGRALLTLVSGDTVTFRTPSRDPGLEVEADDGRRTALEWGSVTRITFRLDAGAGGGTERLHGTVEDRWGNRFTGYLAWGRDGLLSSDVLEGLDGSLPFRRVAEVERDWDAARVTLMDGGGTRVEASGTRSARRHGIRISDRGLGAVTVPWDDLRRIRLHAPEGGSGPVPPAAVHPLRGEVVTRGGESVAGRVLWDADEGWSWQILDGSFRDVEMEVEFGCIASIRRASSRSAVVTLLDGRSWELEDSNDVGEENRGVLVRVDEDPGTGEEGAWVLVTWEEFLEVRFHHD